MVLKRRGAERARDSAECPNAKRTAEIAERRMCTGPSYADSITRDFCRGCAAAALSLAGLMLLDYWFLPRCFEVASILLDERLKSRISL
jgi:hypothetical protein